MLREYNNQLKNYNFYETLIEGYFLDVKDQNKWKVGQIKQIRKSGHKTCIQIKFDGYLSRFNETYDFPAYNYFAPFRRFSLPYTGNGNSQPKRDQPTKSLQSHIKTLNKIQQDIQDVKCQFINQYLRGQLFVFVDYIMTRVSKMDLRNTYDEYIKFFITYLDTFDKILNFTLQFIKQNQKEANFDSNYIYVHPKIALLYSITQFFFNLNSFVSKTQDRVKFFNHFTKQVSVDEINAIFTDKIIKMNLYQKCQKLVNFKSTTNTKSIPWSIKKEVFILMKALNPKQMINEPKQTKQILQYLEYLPYFVKKQVITAQQGDKKYMNLIFNLVVKGNFEGKISGLNQIKKLISNCQKTTSFSSKRESILEQIKQKNLIEFLIDNNNFQSQLFKRALVVFQFCYSFKLFRKEDFPKILKLHKDKHQLELLNFYNSLSQFGAFLNEFDSQYLFKSMISDLPLQQNFIELIKNYTIVLIEKNPLFKRNYMLNDEQGFGLIYFWQQIINQKSNSQLIPKMIQGFATLLNNVYFARQTQRFIISSIRAINTLPNPQSFLKVIHESLKLCKGARMNKAIQLAEKQINIIDTAMKLLKQKTLSKIGYQNLFQFIEEVNTISRKRLTVYDLQFMWGLDQHKCRSHLLKFLRKFRLKNNQDKSHQKIIFKALQMNQIQFMIRQIFCHEQKMCYPQINLQQYQTVDQLIISYLHNKNFIVYNYKHTIRYKRNEYFDGEQKQFLGMKFYVKCIQSSNQEIGLKATKRLLEIFMRPDEKDWGKSANQIKLKNWLKVSHVFNRLTHHKLRSFNIQLQEIQGRMKSLNILQPDLVDIDVKINSKDVVQTISIPLCSSLWKFRLILNQRFNLQNTDFQIQLVQNRAYTTYERQQDLSVCWIQIPKKRGQISVIIHQQTKKHPHYITMNKFRQALSDNFGQIFYANLSQKDEKTSKQSLQILFQIPFIKVLQKSIQKLDFKDWSQIIQINNMRKLEYQLKFINQIKSLPWNINFLNKQGLKHLASVIEQNVGKNCYNALTSLMKFFIEVLKFVQKGPIPFNQQFLKNILFYQQNSNIQNYVEYLMSCFVLINDLNGKIKITSLFNHKNISKILQIVLFTNVASKIAYNLVQICKINSLFPQLNKYLKIFIQYEYLQKKSYVCKPFFQLLNYIIRYDQLALINDSLSKLMIEIRKCNITEKSENQTNQLLYGFLLCLLTFREYGNKFQIVLYQSKESWFKYMLQECLFHPNNIGLRKYKSKELRELGFKFLQKFGLQIKDEDGINQILIPMMTKGAWRKQSEWSVEPVVLKNKKYSGLKNLAATCYINSLLQQLFYIKSFSSQLLSIDSEMIQDKQNIVSELQKIFGYLKYSQNTNYTTLSLCKTFILDGQPIDPRVQTDVDEFFHALMDKLQRNLQQINKKDIINEIFRGEFSNLIIGQECPHTSQRIEHFLSIRLEIKNKKTIYQALDQFIKGEVLQGENSYFCDKCDKKVKALKRVCLKNLPPIMIVTLKRFQFNFDTMQKFKLNTYCSFPQVINFLPYTKQGLQNDEYAKKQDFQYKLKGVVIHYGISQAGHYTSYVRTDKEQWNYFDDQRISDFQLANLENQCFGGIEENPFGDDQDKKKNAYLLIYEKIKPSHNVIQVPQKVLQKSKVYQLVQQENIKNKTVNILFQQNIRNYILSSYQSNSKAFLIYFHTVFLRSKQKSLLLPQFYSRCDFLLQQKQLSKWYLQQITESFLMEFVLYADFDVRYLVTGLLIKAMKNYVDIQFLQQCVALLYAKTIIPFVTIFNQAALIPQYCKYLLNINFAEVILNLIRGKQIKQTSIIRKVQIRKYISAFGLTASGFTTRRTVDVNDFLQAIQSLKVSISIEQVKQLVKSIKVVKSQRSLASIVAKKHKQTQQLKKLINGYLMPQLLTFQPKTSEQYQYNFLLMLMEQLTKVKGKQNQRIPIVVNLYIDALKQAIFGFRSMLMTFKSFLKMCQVNKTFRNFVSTFFNDKQNRKLLTAIKQWLKDSPNAISMIQNSKWGWWKKPKRQNSGLTSKDIQNQRKLPVKQTLSLLNAIVENHPFEQIKQTIQIGDIGFIENRNNQQKVKVQARLGLLVQVVDAQSRQSLICQENFVKIFV